MSSALQWRGYFSPSNVLSCVLCGFFEVDLLGKECVITAVSLHHISSKLIQNWMRKNLVLFLALR